MADYTISIDQDMQDVIEAIARLKGISFQDALRDIVARSLDEIRADMKDPMIGLFHSGRDDVSEHDEDILYGGWKPD